MQECKTEPSSRCPTTTSTNFGVEVDGDWPLPPVRSTNLYGSVKQGFDCRKGQQEKKWLFWERDEPVVSVETGGRLVFGIND